MIPSRDELVWELAVLRQADPVEYALSRKAIADELDIPLRFLDEAVEALLRRGDLMTAPADNPKPADDPVEGMELLDAVREWLAAFVDMPEEAAIAATLWAAATWFLDVATYAAILLITAPTKRAGKTRLLNLLAGIVRRPHRTSGIGCTPAVMFRLNDKRHPTFLIDEAEKLRGDEGGREMIGLLNDGYEAGAQVSRVERGKNGFDVVTFDAFGFRALVAIGDLFDTLMDRAIVLRLQRATRGAKTRRAAGRIWKAEASILAARFARWANDNAEAVSAAEAHAVRPEWLDDRAADLWALLFSIAGVAGGSWPNRAMAAARAQAGVRDETDLEASVQALLDMAEVFLSAGTDTLHTIEILTVLHAREDRPWPRWHRNGNPLSGRGLATLLRPFGIRPRQIWRNATNSSGYRLEDLREHLKRYGPPSHPLDALDPLQDNDLARDSHILELSHIGDEESELSHCETQLLGDQGAGNPPRGTPYIPSDELWDETGRDSLEEDG